MPAYPWEVNLLVNCDLFTVIYGFFWSWPAHAQHAAQRRKIGQDTNRGVSPQRQLVALQPFSACKQVLGHKTRPEIFLVKRPWSAPSRSARTWQISSSPLAHRLARWQSVSRLTRGRDLDVVDRWESTGRRAQVVRPTQTKNDFLLAYRGVAIGDDVAIDKGKKTGRVAHRSASRKTRPASPPSPPRSKKRQEPSWATPPRA